MFPAQRLVDLPCSSLEVCTPAVSSSDSLWKRFHNPQQCILAGLLTMKPRILEERVMIILNLSLCERKAWKKEASQRERSHREVVRFCLYAFGIEPCSPRR
eukprot:TRINITY_DN10571_c0_g1_i1.p1 TRINITY_DN10571_c0_g1~~TRINITY_DN10571_c0_g1_i1.p1  ORF type:complete len:101 (+),score=12.15 TRINITY_DN10571_c0_g1_i1:83-385(+)